MLAAGLTKVAEPQLFAVIIGRYHILPETSLGLVALSLPWVEVVVALALLLGLWVRAAALISSLLCTGFALAVGSALARGLDIECGCFHGSSKVSGAHLGLDLVLLVCSLLLLRRGPGRWHLGGDETSPTVPRSLVAAVFVLLALNGGYLASRYGKEGAPSVPVAGSAALVFEPPALSLGLVEQASLTKRNVVYRNQSAETIEIERVQATCHCTVPTPAKTVLAPGESSELEVTYDAGSNQGPIRQTVELYLKGQPDPILLQVSATVRPVIVAQPGSLDLEVGKPQRVKLTALRPGLEFRLLGAKGPSQITVRQMVAARSSTVEIEVTLLAPLPPPPPGATIWSVALKTDAPDLPPALLYLRAAKP